MILGACPGTGAPRFAFGAEGTTVEFEGHLDLVGVTQEEEINSSFFNFGENAFHSSRIRLIANARVHDHVSAFVEFLSDDAQSPRVFGAFARLSDPKGRDIHLELGKIPLHTGAFPNRSYASKNNLISSPAIYQYHTNLRDDELPATTDQLVANRGNGYFTFYGSGLGSPGDGHGVPVLYDNCWDFGAVIIGTASPVEFAFGATNGTVGNPVDTDTNDGKQVLGRIGVVPAPWVRAGVSGSRGAYLPRSLEGFLPSGAKITDYNQTMAGADLELSYGRGVLYAEYVQNRFESPFVEDLDLDAWYVEGKVTVFPGWYVAGRYDRILFDEVALTGGGVGRWDASLWRREVGVGFKPSKNLLAKLVHHETVLETTPRTVEAFVAAQLALVF